MAWSLDEVREALQAVPCAGWMDTYWNGVVKHLKDIAFRRNQANETCRCGHARHLHAAGYCRYGEKGPCGCLDFVAQVVEGAPAAPQPGVQGFKSGGFLEHEEDRWKAAPVTPAVVQGEVHRSGCRAVETVGLAPCNCKPGTP